MKVEMIYRLPVTIWLILNFTQAGFPLFAEESPAGIQPIHRVKLYPVAIWNGDGVPLFRDGNLVLLNRLPYHLFHRRLSPPRASDPESTNWLSTPFKATGSSEIWDLRKGRRIAHFKVNSLNNKDHWGNVSPNGEILAIPDFENVALFRFPEWEKPYLVIQKKEEDDSDLIWTQVRFSPDSRFMALEQIKMSNLSKLLNQEFGDLEKELLVFELDTGRESSRFIISNFKAYCLGPRGEKIAICDSGEYASDASAIEIFNLETGDLDLRLSLPYERLNDSTSIQFDSSGGFLFFWESWNLPVSWNLQSGESSTVDVRGPEMMALSPDGRYLVLRDAISRLFLYFVPENRLAEIPLNLESRLQSTQKITAISFSGNGKVLGLLEFYPDRGEKDQSVFTTFEVDDLVREVGN
jgi:WD40 repeat protein